MKKDIRKRMVKTLIWPVALYGCETWSLRKKEVDRLQAFEMWIWRRMEKISWKDKKTNVEVLDLVREERNLVDTILKRKKNWIGHIVRGEGLLKTVMEGRMEGKRGRGRPRIGMIDELKEGSYVNMKRKTEIERNGGVGCQEPAGKQSTYDVDDDVDDVVKKQTNKQTNKVIYASNVSR